MNPDVYCTDFAQHMGMVKEGDVIFCDPPYEPMPGKKGFTTYSGTGFSFGDQKRLVTMAVQARNTKGVPTVITNSSAPKIIQLYEENGFHITGLPARRAISRNAQGRGEVEDIIAVLK